MKQVNYKDIKGFMHCTKCLNELPSDVTPYEYSSVELGATKDAIVVWCKRHDCFVASFPYEFETDEKPVCQCSKCTEE